MGDQSEIRAVCNQPKPILHQYFAEVARQFQGLAHQSKWMALLSRKALSESSAPWDLPPRPQTQHVHPRRKRAKCRKPVAQLKLEPMPAAEDADAENASL